MNFGGAVRINKCGVLILIGIGFLLLLFSYNSSRSSSSSNASSMLNSLKFPKRTLSINDGNQISAKSILIAAVDVAIRGGNEVVDVRQTSVDLGEQIKGNTKEGAKDRVTQGDFRSHRIMYYGLRKAFPQVKVISEEHDDKTDVRDVEVPATVNNEISNIVVGDETIGAEDISVWIDPLDATQEYTENLVEYVTTMVCVAVRGVPIIGVIHKAFPPAETYWSLVGYGHSKNLETLVQALKDKDRNVENDPKKSSTKKPIEIIVSRSHPGPVQNLTQQVLGTTVPFVIKNAAGAGYKVLEVLKGNADVYLHTTNIKKWDLCAGNGILNALGGTMMTLNGEKLDYSPESNPVNTKGILAFMKPTELSEKFKDITIDIDS